MTQAGNDDATPTTRDRLVHAARELFWTHGYEATSLKQVLSKAEVNAGSLYYFFKSKDALLQAVLDTYIEMLHPAVIDPAFATTDDSIERIFAVLAGYRQMLTATECTRGCPIGNLALEIAEPSEAVRERLATNFANWCKAIQSCLDAAADHLPADLDRAALSRFILTTMEGGLMQARAHRAIEPFDDSVAHLRTYFDQLLELRKRRDREECDSQTPSDSHPPSDGGVSE